MQRALAGVLGCRPGQVSVKAKTAEKLGPIGEGLAVEARAVVLMELTARRGRIA